LYVPQKVKTVNEVLNHGKTFAFMMSYFKSIVFWHGNCTIAV